MAVASVSAFGASASVTLVDALSGRLVHAVHLSGEGTRLDDVHYIIRDNWLLISYRLLYITSPVVRVVSVELYEPFPQSDWLVVTIRSRFVSCCPCLSSHADVCIASSSSRRPRQDAVHAISRTFASMDELRVLNTTKTRLGVTSLSAICVACSFHPPETTPQLTLGWVLQSRTRKVDL